jgi:hypothetical protein
LEVSDSTGFGNRFIVKKAYRTIPAGFIIIQEKALNGSELSRCDSNPIESASIS